MLSTIRPTQGVEAGAQRSQADVWMADVPAVPRVDVATTTSPAASRRVDGLRTGGNGWDSPPWRFLMPAPSRRQQRAVYSLGPVGSYESTKEMGAAHIGEGL
jgi:hypothetical protein